MSAWRAFVVGLLVTGSIGGGLAQTSAADLFRHGSRSFHRHSDIYAGDGACPRQEPAVYRPRIANYYEPLCYAARPYGISTHLYDRPTELTRGPDADAGTGY